MGYLAFEHDSQACYASPLFQQNYRVLRESIGSKFFDTVLSHSDPAADNDSVDQVFLENRFDIVQVVVAIYRSVVTAEYVYLRSMHTAGFEFLFDSLEVIQILGYIKMPFHLVIPVIPIVNQNTPVTGLDQVNHSAHI